MPDINVFRHEFVPEHYLVSKEEEKILLSDLRIKREQLPKIRREDPVVRLLERIEGPIDEGRIIKIIRRSETAGVAVAYRLLIERAIT